MKTLSVVISVIVSITFSQFANAQSVIPTMRVGDWSFSPEGFVKVGFFDITDQTAEAQNIRLQTGIQTPIKPVKMFLQVELMNADKKNANWLRQAYVNGTLDEGWQIRAGRVFQAAPYYSSPPPFIIRFAKCSREPWTYYGYGVQTERKWNEWSLIADVTGAGGLSFTDHRNFDRIEISGRLGKKFGAHKAGVGYQISDEFTRFHADASFQMSPSMMATVMAYSASSNGNNDASGVVVTLDQMFSKTVSLHGRADLRKSSKNGDEGTILTIGTMFETVGKNFRVIFDYEHNTGTNSHNVYGMAQVRF